MSDANAGEATAPQIKKTPEGSETAASRAVKTPTVNASSDSNPDAESTAQPKAVKELTPEEQMALYEKDLKENDWGHQPC